MNAYTQLIIKELQIRAAEIEQKKLTSVYFGGGTPSLLPAKDILAIHQEIANVGFEISKSAEITIEINPGTIDSSKLDLYLGANINRFSVGVQTFNDSYLKNCGREHTADDSRKTLRFLQKHNLNYSFDLLFGLPHQTLQDLQTDLDELLSYNPPHVSLYNLTVPSQHKMNLARASDDDQAEMFDLIENNLRKIGVFRYELSSFAKPGYESQHNQLYWSDCGYWGVGISAHSYLPTRGPWGQRFFNPTSATIYKSQIDNSVSISHLPPKQVENLALHEALTDYCHTHLRMLRGLNWSNFQSKFGRELKEQLEQKIKPLLAQNLVELTAQGFKMTSKGLPLANRVFFELTYMPEDISASVR